MIDLDPRSRSLKLSVWKFYIGIFSESRKARDIKLCMMIDIDNTFTDIPVFSDFESRSRPYKLFCGKPSKTLTLAFSQKQ